MIDPTLRGLIAPMRHWVRKAAFALPQGDPCGNNSRRRLLPGTRTLALRAWVPGTGWVDGAASLAATPTGLEITLERGSSASPERYTRVLELP